MSKLRVVKASDVGKGQRRYYLRTRKEAREFKKYVLDTSWTNTVYVFHTYSYSKTHKWAVVECQ